MDDLTRIFDAIVSNEISLLFSAIILVIFVGAILSRIPRLSFVLGSLDRSGATLMTTVGILGTFTGIFLGLLDFEVSQIDSSIPRLLDGMKIAFSTSIVGMCMAIIFKIFQCFNWKKEELTDEVSPQELLSTLRLINTNIEAVKNSISSETDTSLLTQVQKLRTTMQDGQRELIGEFRDFTATMAEKNSDALIKALEEVIRDFNTQLNEQFGENFKQLNEAVSALVIWQDNYRIHVETLEERMESAVGALEDSKEAIVEISNRTKGIPEMLTPLASLLSNMDAAMVNLEAQLEATAELRNHAIEAFPVIESNIQNLTTNFSNHVNDAIERMSSGVTVQQQAFDHLNSGYEKLQLQAEQIQQKFTENLNETMSSISTSINMQFENFDKNVEDQLKSIIGEMGNNLASLSEKFVTDYTPLTERLRDVVQMAERIPRST